MNGISYLLDTNIIIGMYQKSAEVIALMQAKQINISQCAFSGITRMELLSFPGITENEEQAIESLMDRMTHLSVKQNCPMRLLLQQQKPMPLSC